MNGVVWPKKTVEPGFYRVRLVDGSDARCYQISFNTRDPWAAPTPPVRPDRARDLKFKVVANEQGYLPSPVEATSLTMCPGERYEFLLDFRALAGKSVYMINEAGAPFPNGGNDPFASGSPYADLATLMRFDVDLPVSDSTVTSLVVPKVLDADFDDVTRLPRCESQSPGDTVGKRCVAAVRNLYLTERVDGTTGASLGLQINGVPFEYDVTETPIKGTYEQWNIINLTVDAHPMHPHLGRFQIVGRHDIDVAGYKLALCQGDVGENACTPGTAPGGVMQVVPDPTPFLIPGSSRVRPDPMEAGWKDAMRAIPGQVLTFVGKWDGAWKAAPTLGQVTAPGAGNVTGNVGSNAANWSYPDVTSGPYVWHCHINSHEDSEMMRTSLVVKP